MLVYNVYVMYNLSQLKLKELTTSVLFKYDPAQPCTPCAVADPRLVCRSFKLEQSSHHVCLLALICLHSLLTPRPTFPPKDENTVDYLHQSTACYPPRNIFSAVDVCNSPPSFVRFLQTFFQTFPRSPSRFEDASQDLETYLEGNLAPSFVFCHHRHTLRVLIGIRTQPPQARRSRFRISSFCLVNQVFHHLLQSLR